MKILILEDEPIIAIDLEDIVCSRIEAEVIHAATVEAGLRSVEAGIDFAMLDINLGDDGTTSLPVAQCLRDRRVPFCFISSNLSRLPANYRGVPRVAKPFRPTEIEEVLPLAA